MNKIVQTRKVFSIVNEKKGLILCGKFPHERFISIKKLSGKDAIRTFPNRAMAQKYLENNYLKYIGEDLHRINPEYFEIWKDLSVTNTQITTTLKFE